MWLKECPRCGKGDMALHRDLYGRYRSCIQCGFYEDLPSDEVLVTPADRDAAAEPALTG